MQPETRVETSGAWRKVVFWVVALIVVAGAVAFGIGVGIRYQTLRLLFELDQKTALITATKRVFGIQPTYAENLQDLWVAFCVAPGKHNGYYVDVGSADGVIGSNTKLLDDLGWKGICIDPFPKNMSSRTCQMFKQPVFDKSGEKVMFRNAGDIGGIDKTVGSDPRVLKAPLVELTTATLDEILAKANAPANIDFMSIDVEGAEVPVLRGLSLDRYRIEAFCIENDGEPARSQIRQILEPRGYKHVRSWKRDDWYVLNDQSYRSYMEFRGK